MTRVVKTPGPDHPITIEPSADRVTVRASGRTLAESTSTLVLREAGYPPVRYIPLADLDRSQLRSSKTITYCPYKGDASYLSITTADVAGGDDVVWFYDQPYPAVEPIRNHVAFYADRVEIDVEPA